MEQSETGAGDYTEERHAWQDQETVEEVVRRIEAEDNQPAESSQQPVASEQTGGLDVLKRTPEEIRRAGLEALYMALGPANMASFLQQLGPGRGDETHEPIQWLDDLEIESIRRRVEKKHGAAAAERRDVKIDDVFGAGLNALGDALTSVGMVRFIQQFDRGKGDYSKERHQWVDQLSLDDIEKSILERRNRPKP